MKTELKRRTTVRIKEENLKIFQRNIEIEGIKARIQDINAKLLRQKWFLMKKHKKILRENYDKITKLEIKFENNLKILEENEKLIDWIWESHHQTRDKKVIFTIPL